MKLYFKGCYLKFLAMFLLTTNLIKPIYAMNSINKKSVHLSNRCINLDKYSKNALDIFNYDQEILYNAEKKYEKSISFSDIVSVHQNIINILECSNYYFNNHKNIKFFDIYDSIKIFLNWLKNNYYKDSHHINLKALYERIIFYFFIVEVLTSYDIGQSINYIAEYYHNFHYDKLSKPSILSEKEALKLFSSVIKNMIFHLEKRKTISGRLTQISEIIQGKKFRTYTPKKHCDFDKHVFIEINKSLSKKSNSNVSTPACAKKLKLNKKKNIKKISKSKILDKKSSQTNIELKEKVTEKPLIKCWKTTMLDDAESIFIMEQSKAFNSFKYKSIYECSSLKDLKNKLLTYDSAKKFITLFINFLNRCQNFDDAYGIKILIMRYDKYISLISSFLNIDCSDLLFDYGSLMEKYGDIDFEECKEVMVTILSELIA